MVKLGFVPSQKRIPSPDMSFARLLGEHRSKWEIRGQYAIWTGSQPAEARQYRLLERMGRKVARIEKASGGSVMHRIAADAAFTVENLMGYWLSLDVDAIWLDVPMSDKQYCLLVVGGTAGKPTFGNVGWICPGCGSSIAFTHFKRPLRDWELFLSAADDLVGKFNVETDLRTCHECGAVHPQSYGLPQDKAAVSTS